jgi:formimidoylglutamate deiminase
MYDMTSLWFESALLPSGWAQRVRLTVADGNLRQVETGVAPAAGDERHGIAVPGLPNVHSHGFQRGIAGLTERRGPGADSFWSWRELMYRFVERLTPEDLEALTAQAYAEMLEAGFTRVGEFHYLHHDRGGAPFADPGELAARIAAAAAASGIGLTLLATFYAHAGFGGAAPAPRQARFVNDPQRFARLLESSRRALQPLSAARLGVAPHSLRAVTPEELTAVVALAGDGVIHVHVAEQQREVEECLAWCGRRPVEWLLENQPVDARWCLVHATHVTAAELAAIAGRQAVVGLCPLTEANLGDGVFPARAFVGQGGRIGIGSDSNVRIDAAAELELLEYGQRLTQLERNVLAAGSGASTGRTLFDATLAGGAQALGAAADAPLGLAAGAPCDIVGLDAAHPALSARHGDALLDSWIFVAGRSAVDSVWRAGVKVVSGGRHRDRDAIAARFSAALRRLTG